jgi:hypothetical protein
MQYISRLLHDFGDAISRHDRHIPPRVRLITKWKHIKTDDSVPVEGDEICEVFPQINDTPESYEATWEKILSICDKNSVCHLSLSLGEIIALRFKRKERTFDRTGSLIDNIRVYSKDFIFHRPVFDLVKDYYKGRSVGPEVIFRGKTQFLEGAVYCSLHLAQIGKMYPCKSPLSPSTIIENALRSGIVPVYYRGRLNDGYIGGIQIIDRIKDEEWPYYKK